MIAVLNRSNRSEFHANFGVGQVTPSRRAKGGINSSLSRLDLLSPGFIRADFF